LPSWDAVSFWQQCWHFHFDARGRLSQRPDADFKA